MTWRVTPLTRSLLTVIAWILSLAVLTARPDPRYEAWQVQGGGALEGLAYVARPGGGAPW